MQVPDPSIYLKYNELAKLIKGISLYFLAGKGVHSEMLKAYFWLCSWGYFWGTCVMPRIKMQLAMYIVPYPLYCHCFIWGHTHWLSKFATGSAFKYYSWEARGTIWMLRIEPRPAALSAVLGSPAPVALFYFYSLFFPERRTIVHNSLDWIKNSSTRNTPLLEICVIDKWSDFAQTSLIRNWAWSLSSLFAQSKSKTS